MNMLIQILFFISSAFATDLSSSPNLVDIKQGSEIQINISDDKLIYDREREWERITPFFEERCSLTIQTHFDIVTALEAGVVTYKIKSIYSVGDTARKRDTNQSISMGLTTDDVRLPTLNFYCYKIWYGSGLGLVVSDIAKLMDNPKMFERSTFDDTPSVLARDFFPKLTKGRILKELVFVLEPIGESTTHFRPIDPIFQKGKIVSKSEAGSPYCMARYFVQGQGHLPMKAGRTVLPPTENFEIMSFQGAPYSGIDFHMYSFRLTAPDGTSLDVTCNSFDARFTNFANLQEQLEGIIELR